ncbi:MAG: hypothetical protein KJO98_06735 [Rhodothermia bacterium]|nr:hypothetical protein [Rhodothermia bacterium]
MIALATTAANAQESEDMPGAADTTAAIEPLAAADSLALMARDSLMVPVRFRPSRPQTLLNKALADTIPNRTFAFELTELLKDEPGSFLYDFSSYGWPHAWSPFGLANTSVGLEWGDVELTDLFTGRARYEVVPLGAIATPRLSIGRNDRLATVKVATRSFEQTIEPLTEFRYQSGGGLQKVTALHAQTRRLGSGSGGLLNLLFWYRGEAASGEYPGSRLRRGRQVYGRLQYTRRRWSVELSDMSSRHPLQAHGGVIPRDPNNFDSIYQRLGAQVVDELARRRTFRNDLWARFVRYLGDRSRLSLLAGRTSESLQYRRPGDTLKVASVRSFGVLAQRLVFGANSITTEARGQITRAEARADTLGFGSVVDRQLDLKLIYEYGGESIRARGSVGLDARSEGSELTSSMSMDVPMGPASLELNASTGRPASTVIEQVGFGPFVTVVGERIPDRTNHVSGRLSIEAGLLDVSAIGAVTSSASWRDLFGTATSDSVVHRFGDGRLTIVTLGAELGLRRLARRGFYLTAAPTLISVTNASGGDLERYDASLPDFYAVGRIGARYLIFSGDLDLDVYVRGRFWSEFRSRNLHTATGLLALPLQSSQPVEASAALDIVVEGGVRVATLFLAYENFLSGTSAVPGNLLVPVYPLAEQRLRFGVFWPLSN